MKKIRDRFSGHSETYQKYRPNYPRELYETILSYTSDNKCCWDCATGNGQVAGVLAPYFEKVYATDISKNQIKHAPALSNISYGIRRAEDSRFKPGTFDLITVAQAIHWFDIPAFLKEVNRVCKPGGALAVWGYGLLQLGPQLDSKIAHFYSEVVGPYWDGERRHIENGYRSIPFNLQHSRDLSDFKIRHPMDLPALRGYLTSWSSVQNYIRENGEDPVDPLIGELTAIWPEGGTITAEFPIFGVVGKVWDTRR